MKQIKIGILGEIRSGKDTVATLIADKLSALSNTPTHFVAFSRGIHDVISLTMPEVYLKGKPRHELQFIGQSMRQLKPDVWIDYLFKHKDFYLPELSGEHLIVTDVRQPNEAIRLQEKGFKIIKVTASTEVRMQRAKDAGDNFSPEMFHHETEIAIHHCPFDYLVDNSFSLEILDQRVQDILEEVLAHD